ncbi:MAG: membrane dipeptidase [Clostridiales bacterium]|nr:membrane dipeptidase [Clostridiales bacterium]
MWIADGHCDTLTHLLDRPCTIEDQRNHINIYRLKKGDVRLQFFAAWIGPRQKYGPPLQRGLRLIDSFGSMISDYSDAFLPILSYSDIKSLGKNQIGALLTVEGGAILEGELANLRILYNLGVRLMTLTWNHRNEICDGIMETKSQSGLSDFGSLVVKEMNRLHMIIDVSHISTKGFWDVLEISKAPIIASHSNAKSICAHPRNLDDDQILALASTEGLIGINFFPNFLSENKAGIVDIIRHIEYIAGLGGIDTVGFGSDFDGIERLPEGIEGPQDYDKIIDELLRLNYTETDIKKICSGNFVRIIKEVVE